MAETATETLKPIAVGHCGNCGYTYKTQLRKPTSERKILTCPECQEGRIIARRLRKQPSSSAPVSPKPKEKPEGEPPKEEPPKEEPPKEGEPPTEPPKTRRQSSVRKVKHARSGNAGSSTRKVRSNRNPPGKGDGGKPKRKPPTNPPTTRRRPATPKPAETKTPTETPEAPDWRDSDEALFPGIY
jgi:hypothetical protein